MRGINTAHRSTPGRSLAQNPPKDILRPVAVPLPPSGCPVTRNHTNSIQYPPATSSFFHSIHSSAFSVIALARQAYALNQQQKGVSHA